AIPGYRCPPVPPPPITTRSPMHPCAAATHTPAANAPSGRACPELDERDASASAPDPACCDTFNRIPMPIRLITSDEPPALTNGNGVPFVGINPSTTLMFTNA